MSSLQVEADGKHLTFMSRWATYRKQMMMRCGRTWFYSQKVFIDLLVFLERQNAFHADWSGWKSFWFNPSVCFKQSTHLVACLCMKLNFQLTEGASWMRGETSSSIHSIIKSSCPGWLRRLIYIFCWFNLCTTNIVTFFACAALFRLSILAVRYRRQHLILTCSGNMNF